MPIKAVAIRANSVVNPGSSLRRRQYDRPANIATPAKATADNKGETICDTAPAKAATMNDRSPAALRSGPCPLRRSRSRPISSPAPSATAKPICWGVKKPIKPSAPHCRKSAYGATLEGLLSGSALNLRFSQPPVVHVCRTIRERFSPV